MDINTSTHRRIKSFRVRVPDIHNFDDPDPFARESPSTTPCPSIRRSGRGLGVELSEGAGGCGRGGGYGYGDGDGKEKVQGEMFLDMDVGAGREVGAVVGREESYSFWDDSDVGEVDVNAAGGAGAGGSEEKTLAGAGSGLGVGAKMGRKVSLRVRENVVCLFRNRPGCISKLQADLGLAHHRPGSAIA